MNNINKGDYIKIMTNLPMVHVNEMFGYNDLTEGDFEKSEYVAIVKSVIDEDTYLILTVSPSAGFRCVIDKNDVIGYVQKSELTQEELDIKEMEEFTAPNVYYPTQVPIGNTVEGKCVLMGREAMAALFPDKEIASLDLREVSKYLKKDILKHIDQFLGKFCRIARQDLIDEMSAKRERFKKILEELKFKEYYELLLGYYEDEGHTITGFATIAVSTTFDEVSALMEHENRIRFENSLGPNYDVISKNKEVLEKELRWWWL